VAQPGARRGRGDGIANVLARVPLAKWPTSEPSIGERFSKVSPALRHSPLMKRP
jgi:hypothetical protein